MKQSIILKNKANRLKYYPFVAFISALLLTLISRPSPEEQAYKIMVSSGKSYNATLKTFGNVLLRLKENYLDPSRLKPDVMFSAALLELERNIPELIIRKKKKILNVTIEKTLKSYNLSKIKTFLDLYKNSKTLFELISKHIQQNKLAKYEDIAINGMLSVLDPHTILLTPEVYREIKTGTQGFFSGIGIVVTYEQDSLVVISPIDDTPAAKAGIKPGDKIVKINNHPTSGMSLNKAVNLLRGQPGSEVTIWIERKQIPHLLKFDLTRSTIRLNSVIYKILHENIGYIRIKQFTQTTSSEVAKAVIFMKKKHIKAIILDMYNNPGGLLKEAGKTADLFLNEGTIFSIVAKNNKIEEIRKASPSETLWNGNLAVLINGGSASASEILAGALKHNHRALVIGEKSFGKGSIQEISENDDGSALKMTIAHYLSAGKYVIQSLGVQPQIAVNYVDLNQNYHSLYWIISQKEEKQKAIPLNIGKKDRQPFFKIALFEKNENNDEEDNENKAPNVLIELTYNFLNNLKINSVLNPYKHKKKIISWFKKQSEAEMKWFMDALGRKGIDWSLSEEKGQSILEYSVTFNKNPISASEQLEGIIEVKNLGTASVSRLRALIKNKPEANPIDVLFGKINPGDKKSHKFTYKIPINTPNSIWPFKIKLTSDDPADKKLNVINPKSPIIRIKASPKPVFYINYHLMDNSGGNGDGLCQKGEKERLRITISNEGNGKADVNIKLKLTDLNNNEISLTHKHIGDLESHETVSQDLFVKIPEDYNSPDLLLLLSIEDQIYKIKISKLLIYPIEKTKHSLINTNGLFKINKKTYIFDTPRKNVNPTGIVEKNSVFPIVGRFGGWIKIKLNSERTAFIKRTSGISVNSEKFFPKTFWSPVYQIIPPTIQLKKQIPLITDNCVINLDFSVFHPFKIKDVYAELTTVKNYRKLFYIRGNGNVQNIKKQINLEENSLNLLIIRARSDKYVNSDWKQVIYCIKSNTYKNKQRY